MGFLAAIPPLLATAATGAGTVAGGASLGGSLAAGAAASTATIGGISAGTGAAIAGGTSLIAAASQPKFPKPPTPPTSASFIQPKGVPSLFAPGGDSANGTFFGNNRAPQVAGGKKVLLGE